MSEPLLDISHATKIYGGGFFHSSHQVIALQDFNLTIPEKPAKVTTIAGESGSGKTTLANAVLGFVRLTSGQIRFRGHDISQLNRQQALEYRRQVQAIFQDPYAVYNPFYRVKHIFDLVIRNFKLAENKREAREMIEDALQVVGMRGGEILEKYPHQLSGGQRQRMMVARAYLVKPSLIVADEPVSMVDASLRAMILDIMLRLRDEHNISFLYITHDLSTAYQVCDQIVLLYQGIVAEKGDTVKVIENPKHPYVQALIDSIPVPDPTQKWSEDIVLPDEEELRIRIDSGCRFYPRCPYRMDRCLVKQPPLYHIDGVAHQAACYLYDDKPHDGSSSSA
ncbi:MAG: ABC transporter ATP-binding protein [Chloroflexi bacterium]|nr:ABC transporter ATP-binding protein [Chloroflexota bacterium]MCI0578966.1 ABC transporter ATP-binding protein [Chloroflexota bacterium]MCI0645096.1 ABC transporter ATP-binding protein [Chloroflexota bacterium]MCI0731931.1 ABC transporter ATP-binding protein [Chloroflexota bacterium]